MNGGSNRFAIRICCNIPPTSSTTAAAFTNSDGAAGEEFARASR
jgi:hypothetical protein